MSEETIKQVFEKLTGVPNAWTDPTLMQSRNGFIAGWEAALAEQVPVAWIDPIDLKNLISGVEDRYQVFEVEMIDCVPLYIRMESMEVGEK